MKILKEGTLTIDKDGRPFVTGFHVEEGTVQDLCAEAHRRIVIAAADDFGFPDVLLAPGPTLILDDATCEIRNNVYVHPPPTPEDRVSELEAEVARLQRSIKVFTRQAQPTPEGK